MAQVSLQDFLKDINTNYKADMDKARDGVASGAWDGPPLPLEFEYRAEVEKGEYKNSNAGNQQIVLTFVITAPEEFAGRKLQEYYQPNPGNEIAQSKFSALIGALGPNLEGLSGDWGVLAKRFEGTSGVIALRAWGDDNDRFGVRWVNADRGQNLKTNIKPPKPKTAGAANLRPDVSIRKAADVAPASTAVQEAEGTGPELPTNPATLPGVTQSRPAGGPNLPPGLR